MMMMMMVMVIIIIIIVIIIVITSCFRDLCNLYVPQVPAVFPVT